MEAYLDSLKARSKVKVTQAPATADAAVTRSKHPQKSPAGESQRGFLSLSASRSRERDACFPDLQAALNIAGGVAAGRASGTEPDPRTRTRPVRTDDGGSAARRLLTRNVHIHRPGRSRACLARPLAAATCRPISARYIVRRPSEPSGSCPLAARQLAAGRRKPRSQRSWREWINISRYLRVEALTAEPGFKSDAKVSDN